MIVLVTKAWSGKKNFNRISLSEKEDKSPKSKIAVIPINDPKDNVNLLSIFVTDPLSTMGNLSKYVSVDPKWVCFSKRALMIPDKRDKIK